MQNKIFKNIAFFSFLILTSNFVFANDSGKNYTTYSYEDSIAVAIILDSCWANRTTNPTIALEYGVEALGIIEDKEITMLKSKTLNYIGVVYRKLGNLSKSYEYFKYALNLAKALNDKEQIGYTYNNFGDYYFTKASYSLALENVLLAYQIFEKLDHKIGMAYSLNYMGEIYIRHQEYDKALKYLDQAKILRYDVNDMRGYANSIINVGQIYFLQNDFDKAREKYTQAMRICKDIKYRKGISIIVSFLGDINYANNKLKKAKSCFAEALEMDENINNKFGVITNLNKLGLAYQSSNEYKIARESFEQALKLAKEAQYLDQEMASYLNLSKLQSKQKSYKQAHENLQKYITLKDSIYSYENMGKFADLQTLFATQNKIVENEILKKEIEFEKITYNYLIVILTITIIIIVLLISKSRTQKSANRLLKELNDSKDKFFSILAHDLKNPFQGLLGYTDLLKNEYDLLDENEVRESISSLHSVTRNVYQLLEGLLEWSRAQTGRIEYNPTFFAISEEVNDVINLSEENAKAKNIKVHSQIENSIKVFADRNMVNTIIRNLVANAIKFSNSGGTIEIITAQEKEFVIITIQDQGIGMGPEELNSLFRIDVHHTTLGTNGEEGTGVGLILCKELVESNKGKIWAESKVGVGSKFIFSIPVSKK
jgi:signal transduction histidine kinase/Tfp pilus assembly protein PilF